MEEIRPDILSSDVPGDSMLWEWPGHRLPSGERIGLLTQERVQFTQRPPVICLCCSQDVLCCPHDQAWQHLNQPVDDPLGKSPARPAVVTTSPVGGSCSAGPAAGPLTRIRWRPCGPAG